MWPVGAVSMTTDARDALWTTVEKAWTTAISCVQGEHCSTLVVECRARGAQDPVAVGSSLAGSILETVRRSTAPASVCDRRAAGSVVVSWTSCPRLPGATTADQDGDAVDQHQREPARPSELQELPGRLARGEGSGLGGQLDPTDVAAAAAEPVRVRGEGHELVGASGPHTPAAQHNAGSKTSIVAMRTSGQPGGANGSVRTHWHASMTRASCGSTLVNVMCLRLETEARTPIAIIVTIARRTRRWGSRTG